MLTRWTQGWNELDQMFSAMNNLRTYMDRVLDEPEGGTWTRSVWPRMQLLDGGSTLTVSAEVPGFTEKDLKITLNQDMVTVAGERKVDAPSGYSIHRQERPDLTFSRSFRFPCRVNPERATAVVKNGILTLSLDKAAEAMPRQISVKAS